MSGQKRLFSQAFPKDRAAREFAAFQAEERRKTERMLEAERRSAKRRRGVANDHQPREEEPGEEEFADAQEFTPLMLYNVAEDRQIDEPPPAVIKPEVSVKDEPKGWWSRLTGLAMSFFGGDPDEETGSSSKPEAVSNTGTLQLYGCDCKAEGYDLPIESAIGPLTPVVERETCAFLHEHGFRTLTARKEDGTHVTVRLYYRSGKRLASQGKVAANAAQDNKLRLLGQAALTPPALLCHDQNASVFQGGCTYVAEMAVTTETYPACDRLPRGSYTAKNIFAMTAQLTAAWRVWSQHGLVHCRLCPYTVRAVIENDSPRIMVVDSGFTGKRSGRANGQDKELSSLEMELVDAMYLPLVVHESLKERNYENVTADETWDSAAIFMVFIKLWYTAVGETLPWEKENKASSTLQWTEKLTAFCVAKARCIPSTVLHTQPIADLLQLEGGFAPANWSLFNSCCVGLHRACDTADPDGILDYLRTFAGHVEAFD